MSKEVGPGPDDPKVAIGEPGLRWDEYDAYLFDIDGTLLRAQGGVHNDAFPDSVRDVMGEEISLENIVLHGNTDSRILAQAFASAGIARERWEPHRAAIHARMCSLVEERRHSMQITVMPGIRASLDHLQRCGRVLGAATGNLESIGWTKIELAGLRAYFTFGGFSDAHEDRAAMVGAAAGASLHASHACCPGQPLQCVLDLWAACKPAPGVAGSCSAAEGRQGGWVRDDRGGAAA